MAIRRRGLGRPHYRTSAVTLANWRLIQEGWSTSDPFLLQDRIDIFVRPPALEPQALCEVSLATHAHSFQEAPGGNVFRVRVRLDPMQAQLKEREIQQHRYGLARKALPLKFTRKRNPEGCLPLIRPVDFDATVADEDLFGLEGDGELEPMAGQKGRCGLLLLDKRSSLFPGKEIPALESGNLGIVAICKEGLQVTELQLAQKQPRRCQWE